MAPRTLHPGQLDLFIHSCAVILANETIDALLAHEAGRAGGCFDRLRAGAPDHWALESLHTLCRALADWPLPSATPAEIADAVRTLEAGVQPAADVALGDKAPRFMRPFWRDLADAARLHAYDAAFPQSHCAGLYLRCGDPPAAATAADSIPNRDDNADALHWLAVAHYRMVGLDAARAQLMRLALLAPQRLATTLADIADPLLHRDWSAFCAACYWLDPHDTTMAAWFPAWYLAEHPGMRIAPDEANNLPTTPAAETYVAIARVLELEKSGYSAELVAARSRLRDLDAELFAHYMARREACHR